MQHFSRKENSTVREDVGALFSAREIKKFFLNYLLLIGVVEGLILFLCFSSQLGSSEQSFPWRTFWFSAFTAPVSLTFLLGLLVAAFNNFFYRRQQQTPADQQALTAASERSWLVRLQALFYSLRQLPFLLGLFLLALAAGAFYKLEAILAYLGSLGTATAHTLLWLLVSLVAGATLVAITYLVSAYKLRRQRMQAEYREAYRQKVLAELGVLVLEDGTLLDQQGRPLSPPPEDETGPTAADQEASPASPDADPNNRSSNSSCSSVC